MKIKIISLVLLSIFIVGCSSKKEVKPVVLIDTNKTIESTNESFENNVTEEVTDMLDNNNTLVNTFENNESSEDSNSTEELIIEDINETINTENDLNKSISVQSKEIVKINDTGRTFTKFEKTFINHVAYNHYKKAITLLYESNHSDAYREAIMAKDIFDNSSTNEEIQLPYIPGYVRENAATPKRIYYKIVESQNYELKRLIRKIKLLNPPIPMVVLAQTSTYIDITVENFGELPLDNFEIEINYEKVTSFDKINPNESKTYRYYKIATIEQISFNEEYGFAPSIIEFEEE